MNEPHRGTGEVDPVAEAEAEVEATRAELADTIGELSDRLNPKKQLAREKEAALRKARARVDDLREGTVRTESAVRDAGSAAAAKAKEEFKGAWEVAGRGARAGGGVWPWAGAALVAIVVVLAVRRRSSNS